MKEQNHLPLAALLHDLGKFRQRAIDRYKPHQEHSFEFVNTDFADFFSPCGDIFKNAILHHHPERQLKCAPQQLEHLTEKQVILADRLSATEREDEERDAEDFVQSSLISPLSRLVGADKEKEFRYELTALSFDRDTIIPTETASIDQEDYMNLWQEFADAFRKATAGKTYEPAHYQTIVALLHKYTARIPSATPWGQGEQKAVPDISLYDHLRTTAAIAACIEHELNTDDKVDEELSLLSDKEESDRKICALIKGDISGIQNFLYHIQSEGAANQLRGRSFYLQLLTEAIAHWVLKQFDLPITNLLLASGGHFFILAPYSRTKNETKQHPKTDIRKIMGTPHQMNFTVFLDYTDVKVSDFTKNKKSIKNGERCQTTSTKLKLKKWAEMEPKQAFENLFEPQENREVNWQFDELGRDLRQATTLVTFEVPESPIP